ncbi:hypothetical protein BH11PSE2_BH11PSE2_22290 [soil metagenome]
MGRKAVKLLIGLSLAMAITPQDAAGSEHQIGGRTAEVVFARPKVASVARAACEGDEAWVKRGVAAGVSPDSRGLEDFTLLNWAISCGNERGVEALLEAGAQPNHTFGHSYSAILFAVQVASPQILQALLRHGGSPNAVDLESSKSALELALSRGLHGGGWEPYELLLKSGADVNQASEAGNTIATWAATLGRFDKVKQLLDLGYRYDLNFLGLLAQVNDAEPTPTSDRLEVLAKLKDLGVKFPVVSTFKR